MARILIVDDSPSNRELLRTMLEHSGHQVQEAADGEEALLLMRQVIPDLAILDIQMPKMDGYALLAAMRADPALAQVSAVALSAFAMKRDVERGLEAGFLDYLTKPITIRQLREALARYLPTRSA
jgi:CheY-like chemotaxis protein